MWITSKEWRLADIALIFAFVRSSEMPKTILLPLGWIRTRKRFRMWTVSLSSLKRMLGIVPPHLADQRSSEEVTPLLCSQERACAQESTSLQVILQQITTEGGETGGTNRLQNSSSKLESAGKHGISSK